MMNTHILHLLLINPNPIPCHQHLRHPRIHQTDNRCHKTSIQQIPVLINDKQVDSHRPDKAALHDAKTDSVRCSGRLEHLVYEPTDLDSHLSQCVLHASVLTGMCERAELDVESEESFIRLPRLGTD